jgi:hypothetical protein
MAGNGQHDIYMDIPGLTGAMDALSTVGTTLTAGWSAVQSEIAALDGQLGQGPLGQAFISGYRPTATAIVQSADKCCQTPGRFAEAGHQCAADYTQADARAHDALSSVNGPELA